MVALIEPEVSQMKIDLRSKNEVRSIIRIVLIGVVVLIPIVLFSIAYWNVSEQQKSSWMITTHFAPTTAGFLTGVQTDSWAVILASEQFAQLDPKVKEAFAKSKSDAAWDLMGKSLGYRKSELDQWFKETGKSYSSYPIKKVSLSYGGTFTYRDFSSTRIPKQNIHRAAMEAITSSFSGSTVFLIALWIVLPLTISLFVMVGTVGLFLSKGVPLLYKIVAAGLLVVIALGGLIIRGLSHPKHIGESFQVFTHGSNYVSAKGTWRGVNQKIAYAVNAATIECFRDQGVCKEADAALADMALMVNTTEWPIVSWDDKEVIVEEGGECTTTKMIINFRDKAVTQIKTPKEPLPQDCIVGVGGKFISELVDGIDVAFPKRK